MAYLKEEPSAPIAARPAPPPVANGSARPVPRPASGKAKPNPPLPPAKRPAASGRKLAPPPVGSRDSGVSMSNSSDGRATPDGGKPPSLAGGLAEALRARQASMQGKSRDDEDDW